MNVPGASVAPTVPGTQVAIWMFFCWSTPPNTSDELEEALRSPHYRAYLKSTGKLSLQFGYSDSGRYVGQLAASYLIERLRLKISQVLEKNGVSGVEVILFDTHGESIGRGAHPGGRDRAPGDRRKTQR